MNNRMKMRMLEEYEQSQRNNSPQHDPNARRWTITENNYGPQNENPNMGGYNRAGYGEGDYSEGNYGRMDYGRGYQPDMEYGYNGGYDAGMYGGEMRYDMPENRRYKNGRFAPKNSMEMHYGGGNHQKMQIGFAGGDSGMMPFNQMTAEKWVRSMKNSDGSKGPKWQMQQAQEVMEQVGAECDPIEFYAALNAMYSDYGEVMKKFGLADNPYIFAEMAIAFIDDMDAQPDKLARYYQYVVKH